MKSWKTEDRRPKSGDRNFKVEKKTEDRRPKSEVEKFLKKQNRIQIFLTARNAKENYKGRQKNINYPLLIQAALGIERRV
ncbi:MAG: hypothetical protein A3F91_07770 [Flavobacteria bacterium RIFCSPLOWO2_12_FULL_35_11]|nr:MAG: hypothetical protein A3F91_07770 [Flavobacteria bacterium RIFCSPLOWO2_12_FULL_35_11]